MNSSIIVQQSIDFDNVQIFAFATMFKFADVFDVYDHVSNGKFGIPFDFDCILISKPGYYFVVCY